MKPKFVPMASVEDTILLRLYEQTKSNLRQIENELKKRYLLK